MEKVTKYRLTSVVAVKGIEDLKLCGCGNTTIVPPEKWVMNKKKNCGKCFEVKPTPINYAYEQYLRMKSGGVCDPNLIPDETPIRWGWSWLNTPEGGYELQCGCGTKVDFLNIHDMLFSNVRDCGCGTWRATALANGRKARAIERGSWNGTTSSERKAKAIKRFGGVGKKRGFVTLLTEECDVYCTACGEYGKMGYTLLNKLNVRRGDCGCGMGQIAKTRNRK